MTEQPTTFMICNMVTGECTVEAPTPELIERTYHYTDAWHKPRGIEQVIVEIPKVYGLNIHTYRQFPRNMIFDGVALYAKRKAGAS